MSKQVDWPDYLKNVAAESAEIATMENLGRWMHMMERAAHSYVFFGFHIDEKEGRS